MLERIYIPLVLQNYIITLTYFKLFPLFISFLLDRRIVRDGTVTICNHNQRLLK
jgi:hypothetical protein